VSTLGGVTRPTIALIGAGSTVFAKNLLGDILSDPALAHSRVVLHDIDAERMVVSETVAHRLADAVGAEPEIVTTTDRRRALDGATHAITMFQVGGYRPATVTDMEIPARHGLRQTIGDTLGIGGIMRAARTIPVLLDVCDDAAEVGDNTLVLNYVNPMAMLCMAAHRATSVPVIGLCHSVQGTAAQLAEDLGVDVDDLAYRCAGINHMAFYLQFGRRNADGVVTDLYPALHDRATANAPVRLHRDRADGGVSELSDAVRYEVLRRLGYFVTESSEHFAEYVPWFIRRDRPDLLERFAIPLDEYPRRCEEQIAGWERLRDHLTDPSAELRVRRSHEYGASVISASVTGEPVTVYGNVANRRADGARLIDNLPDDCCVEVPCAVDADGVHPEAIGALPVHLAALMQTNINVQSITVDAVLNGDRRGLHHAAMLDPHTAAELPLDDIERLVGELLNAHGDLIPAALRR